MDQQTIDTIIALVKYLLPGIIAGEVIRFIFFRQRQHVGHGVNCFCCSNLRLGYVVESPERSDSIFACTCAKAHFGVTGIDQEMWHKNIMRALDCHDFRPLAVQQDTQNVTGKGTS